MTIFETVRQLVDLSDIRLEGRVLDIGGGGEGVIALHSGDRVVAIDNRADELMESPDMGLKVVMDACELAFLDDYFDTITCFYSLLYMDVGQVEQCLGQVFRVLKPGGMLWVWDAVLPPVKQADVFITQLDIKLSARERLQTGYGVHWRQTHSPTELRALCERIGFVFCDSDEVEAALWLCMTKK